jgi:DNA polymerase-1
MATNKLLLFDGLGIVRRCYEANLAPDSVDKAQSAAGVALQSMIRGLREHRPSHALVIFDHGGPTWRHDLYPLYKANRKPMSPYLAAELFLMKERMADLGWALMAHPGEEADDTIKGVAQAAVEVGEEVVVLANDKDLVRLVDYGVQVYNHYYRCWQDHDWCMNRFGVKPGLLTDFLALMGDSVDNIPGVDRIGEKTAARLLNEYGQLTAVLDAAAAGDIKGVIGKRLVEQRERALISLELASLRSTFSSLDLWMDELEAPSLR